MSKYEISLSNDYCPDWTVEDGIREILQNALDSPAQMVWSYENEILTVTSKGIDIPSKSLLLGCSGKRDDVDSVGGHGEGFKISTLVLLREGLDVVIRNGDRLWEPVFEYSEKYDTELLVVYESPLDCNTDLIFEVTGVTQEVFDVVLERCLYLHEDLGEVIETPKGRILKDIQGKVYVGGLWVMDEKSLLYSYDFNPDVLPLNRDRKAIDSWDLTWATSQMWEYVGSDAKGLREVATMLRDEVIDVKLGQHHYPDRIKNACYELFVEDNGDVLIATSNSEKDSLSTANKKVDFYSATPYISLVKGSTEYYKSLEESVVEEEEIPSVVEMIYEWRQKWMGHLPKEANDELSDLEDLMNEKGVSWDG